MEIMSIIYLSGPAQASVFWTEFTKFVIAGKWEFNRIDYKYGAGRFWRLLLDFLGTKGDTGTEGDIITNIADSIKLSMLGEWKS